jgi:hypothetical protein
MGLPGAPRIKFLDTVVVDKNAPYAVQAVSLRFLLIHIRLIYIFCNM